MIVTEEEAFTKRCQEGFGPSSDKREDPDNGLWTQPSNCLGSGCMAWNWLYGNRDSAGIDRTKGDDYARGFCGKAGG